jgi:hypothetical protein
MNRRIWAYAKMLAVVGVAGAFLFGNVTIAQAGISEDQVVELADGPAPNVAGSRTVSLSQDPNICRDPPCNPNPGPAVITCSINVSNPSLTGDRVGTIGVVQCSHPIAVIDMDVVIAPIGGTATIRTRVRYGQDNNTAAVESRCRTRNWQSQAVATLIPPPGYYPQSAVVVDYSPLVPIAHPICPV